MPEKLSKVFVFLQSIFFKENKLEEYRGMEES